MTVEELLDILNTCDGYNEVVFDTGERELDIEDACEEYDFKHSKYIVVLR